MIHMYSTYFQYECEEIQVEEKARLDEKVMLARDIDLMNRDVHIPHFVDSRRRDLSLAFGDNYEPS